MVILRKCAFVLALLLVPSALSRIGQEGGEDADVVSGSDESGGDGNDDVSSSSASEKAEELLREIVRYGLDRGRELTDVEERELYDRGVKLDKANPAHFVAIFNRQKQRGKELADYAYAALETSTLLARQFRLTRQQVVYGLERVELRQTDLFRRCPYTPRSARQSSGGCPPRSYPFRTADGSCNNLARVEWGSSFAPFLRFLPPVYGDTVGSELRRPVRARAGRSALPSPRMVSSQVHKESTADTQQFSMMVMQWGQFLDHDLTFTPQKMGFNESLIQCCDAATGRPLPQHLRHRDCFPIEISPDDDFYARFNQTCMEFVRSSPALRRDCSLGPRDQMNQVTSFIDASNVYGSTREEMDSLRLFQGGKLRYKDLHIRKSLLPALEQSKAKEECRISTPNLHCFYAGDTRVNEQPGLTGMHTVWLREHNRLVARLARVNPHWDDERLFQEARKIVGAMHQHITYNEWLPIVLGRRVLDIFELTLSPRGHYDGYNDTVNPTVANAFASAAFRFGHSLVRNTLSRCNKDFREVPYFVRLHKELNNPSNLHNFGSVDRILLGLASKKLARRDEFITAELTNHLFQNPRTPYGMDLAALNIQRGRDHGIASYNEWREQCGLQRFRRFSDMTSVMAARTVAALERVYDHVDDVDLFPGGLAERPVVSGLVGPTFACIIGQQFLNLRRGDRFWYENPGVFTLDQLHEIRKTSLARTICDNLDDVERIQPYAFLMIDDFSNRRSSCRRRFIPRMDLSKWREEDYGGGNLNELSAAFKEDPEGGVAIEDDADDEDADAPTQNSAFLALKKVAAFYDSSSSREQQQQQQQRKQQQKHRPYASDSSSSRLTPMHPLSSFYLHTPEVPSRPLFGGHNGEAPRENLKDFIDGLDDDEEASLVVDSYPQHRFHSVEEFDSPSAFIISSTKSREGADFSPEVPRQLTREQFFRFFDDGGGGDGSRDSKEIDVDGDVDFRALPKKPADDDDDVLFRPDLL